MGRNVAALVDAPKGQQAGRPPKSLTLEQAVACRRRSSLTISLSCVSNQEPWGRRSLWLRDPDGNIVNLSQQAGSLSRTDHRA